MSNNYTVYIHIGPSNKKYIGLTSQKPEYRWKNNGKGYINNQHFYRAIEKYGWDNFQHIIIARGLTEDEAKWLEKELIRVNDSIDPDKGYNNSLGGEGAKGATRSEEFKKQLSERISGEKHPMYGKTGKNNPRYGCKHTEEAKHKMSEAAKNRVVSEETKQKISEANKGENNYWYGKRSINAKGVICLTTKRLFLSATEGAKYYNIRYQNISKCCRGKAYSAGKYNGQKLVWKYINYKHNKKFRTS